MRNRLTRILLFAGLVIVLAFIFNISLTAFTGDGKDTPEEALPTDANYEWIEGPKSDKEQRYFFLSNGQYFGTGYVEKNLKGWSAGEGTYSKLPNALTENTITSAHSDSKILFGLIKPKGNIQISVNNKHAKLIQLDFLSDDILSTYNVEGYAIWYIDLEEIDNAKSFTIKVLGENDSVLNALSI
ncbi:MULTISPECIES: hypothetical protein [Bacillales]|uniref:Uncharacterized protein n=1 Tax=Lysinibacillus halotolerans TaxID=1368476 RepID=A0A3M8HG32_9BACI|nr:hypothetical protein [Lysinibacillus halotolerans]RND01436.1 hypothetical protein EC501_02155 [Lysinibacillus halotolerans]